MTKRVCVLEWCDREAYYAKPYCRPHFMRACKDQPLELPIRVIKRRTQATCLHCDRPARSGDNLCMTHDRRLKNGTDLHLPIRNCSPIVPWGTEIARVLTSGTAHKRVKRLWGRAIQYSCIQCGGPAHEWAYDGTDPTEQFALERNSGRETRIRYSAYPEFYMPMCRRCHRTRDSNLAAAELREYREWKHQTGLTLADITVVRPIKIGA